MSFSIKGRKTQCLDIQPEKPYKLHKKERDLPPITYLGFDSDSFYFGTSGDLSRNKTFDLPKHRNDFYCRETYIFDNLLARLHLDVVSGEYEWLDGAANILDKMVREEET